MGIFAISLSLVYFSTYGIGYGCVVPFGEIIRRGAYWYLGAATYCVSTCAQELETVVKNRRSRNFILPAVSPGHKDGQCHINVK